MDNDVKQSINVAATERLALLNTVFEINNKTSYPRVCDFLMMTDFVPRSIAFLMQFHDTGPSIFQSLDHLSQVVHHGVQQANTADSVDVRLSAKFWHKSF